MKYLLISILAAATGMFGISHTSYPSIHWKKVSVFYQDSLQASIERGQEVYAARCLGCHQENGTGLSGVYPPLAGSDHLNSDAAYLIHVILNGQNEPYTVNGVSYNLTMAPMNYMSDDEIADVLNYIGNSWNNQFGTITSQQVEKQRNSKVY